MSGKPFPPMLQPREVFDFMAADAENDERATVELRAMIAAEREPKADAGSKATGVPKNPGTPIDRG